MITTTNIGLSAATIYVSRTASDYPTKSDEAKPIKYANPRSKVRKGTTTKSRSRVRKPPTKRLDDGVAGVANKDGTIEIDPNLSPVEHEKTVAHEEQHVKDMDSGKLDYDDKYVYWNDAK